jgi:CHAT domain-containing protein
VDSLKATYPLNNVLEGTAATRAALIRAAPRAGIIHYAGHAVFDDARPERSALVLAGTDTTGRLTAEAASALHLGGVRLVVLASCSTVRSREGRSGGFAGLSGALLAAGAGGVVGSLWQADDRLTQPLMLAFHRAYHRHPGDPAAALQQAQLQMLHDTIPERRSPAAWAGFRYIGR